MARDFDGVDDSLIAAAQSDFNPINMTVAFWARVPTGHVNNASDRLMECGGNFDGFIGWGFELHPNLAAVIWGGGGPTVIGSEYAYALDTWTHYCLTSQTNPSQSHAFYANAIQQGTTSAGTRTVASKGLTLGHAHNDLSNYGNFRGMEFAIWDVILTSDERVALSKGFSPLLIRPQSLKVYLPIYGKNSPEVDLKNKYSFTIVSTTPADHSRVLMPAAPFTIKVTPLPTAPTSGWGFTVDWNGDGVLGNVQNEYIQSNVLSVDTHLGRDGPSPVSNKSSTGWLKAKIRNPNGLYSPRNTSSPLYGNLVMGRLVQFSIITPVASIRWTGRIKRIKPIAGPEPMVELEAVTGLGWMEFAKVYVGRTAVALPEEIIGVILDVVGWSATARDLSTGISTLLEWRANGETAPELLHEVEDAELGFIYDDRLGNVVFENRHERFFKTSLDVWSDDLVEGSPFYEMNVEDNESEDKIINYAESRTSEYTDIIDAIAFFIFGIAVWQTNEAYSLGPGESRVFTCIPDVAPLVNEDNNTQAQFSHMLIWIEPDIAAPLPEGEFHLNSNYIEVAGVATTDITPMLTEEYSNSAKLTVTNTHATNTAYITHTGAGGAPIWKIGDTIVTAKDIASQAKYGQRPYRFPSKWLPNINDGKDQVDYLVGRYPEPLPFIKVPFTMNHDYPNLSAREISDRITFKANALNTYFGLNQDFFIESIDEQINFEDGVHHIQFALSPVDPASANYWILGVSTLGINTYLGY